MTVINAHIHQQITATVYHSNKEERKEKFGSMYCESCDVGYLAPKLYNSHLLTKLHKCRANIKT